MAKKNIGNDLNVVGDFTATTKSFLIPHPTKSGYILRHGNLEGPEHAVYIRGKLFGPNKIEFPSYWPELVDMDTITVSLTPVGEFQKLYVKKITEKYIEIANEAKAMIKCHYTIMAERKDVPKLIVEIPPKK